MINLDDYTWLRIQPVDAWFFRDGRPSNRGEDQSDLESEFPPNAPTVVGALRAALARSKKWNGRGSWADNLKPFLGDGFEDLGSLSFLGPLLMQKDELLWPMPQHVAGHMVEDRFQPALLLAPAREPIATDIGLVHLPTLPSDWKEQQSRVAGLNAQQRNRPPEPRSDQWVTTSGMSKILAGQIPDRDDCCPSKDLFEHESRIGIHRDKDSPSIYSPRYVRLKQDVALAMAIRGLPEDWKVPALLPLGGESRLAGVESLKDRPKLPQTTASAGQVTVISVTPARFGNPWWGAGPGDDSGKLSPELSGPIVTAALDRPQRIGGWDSVKGQPLSLVPFTPPGTVWWIETQVTGHSGLLQLGDTLQTRYGNGLAFLSSSPRPGT